VKTVLLLRHAKSSWKDPGLDDHDRPLNKRGKKAAPRMGRLLAEEDLVPELILSSTARRARDTAERVAEAAGYEGDIEQRPDLYHAAPHAYFDALDTVSDDVQRVMLVGHNPAMEVLVAMLSGTHHRFPTAALAEIALDIDAWRDARDGTARLMNLWLPRELE
jgi:phosphohistidine phosphatase